jgi:hypothetical protein
MGLREAVARLHRVGEVGNLSKLESTIDGTPYVPPVNSIITLFKGYTFFGVFLRITAVGTPISSSFNFGNLIYAHIIDSSVGAI